ncbi:MAG TPA: deoxyribose-phosphate aldolase [Myxococcaceae bacterium]|nr:deoxyribose-phosphate aldolase [Myxococcaceae bacterium]
MPSAVVNAWVEAVQAWTGAGAPPAARALGLSRPGGTAPQRPWGPQAAEALGAPGALAPYIDHTLLRPDATEQDVETLAAEARAHRLGGACVHPLHVATLVRALGDCDVEPVAVVGFPHGAHLTEIKLLEARRAADEGARAVDVVALLGRLKAGEVEGVLSELRALVSALAPVPVRVILETGLLPARAVVLGAGLALVAGCDAVKTSTGFNGPGARPEDVALLRAVVGAELGVKASGGIRTAAQARALVAAGASRLGASCSLELLGGAGG